MKAHWILATLMAAGGSNALAGDSPAEGKQYLQDMGYTNVSGGQSVLNIWGPCGRGQTAREYNAHSNGNTIFREQPGNYTMTLCFKPLNNENPFIVKSIGLTHQ